MTARFTTAEDRRHQFTTSLIDQGHLHSSRWQNAFRAVPREQFVTRFCVPSTDGLAEYDLTDPTCREAALSAVYSDNTLITQWDTGGTATSSSSTPSLMGSMLEHLDVHPGHTVLEIGTGTGYHAALLAHALGDDAVTTIDVAPELVDAARQVLTSLSCYPTVVCGNGIEGVPARAPFDRIIATCGMARVPAAWLHQLRPEGVIVVNVSFGVAVLRHGDRGVSGPFVGSAAFMEQRDDPADLGMSTRDVIRSANGQGDGDHDAPWLAADTFLNPAVAFLRKLLLPRLHYALISSDDGTSTYYLYDPSSNAWARATREAGRAVVTGDGRNLWSDLIDLVTSWNEHGKPTIDQHGLTVRPDGTHLLWLDEPDNEIAVLPA